METYSIYHALDTKLWIFVGDISDEELYTMDDLEALEERFLKV